MSISAPDSAVIAFATLVVGCSPVLPLLLQAPPEIGEVALVVTAPWDNTANILDEAEVAEVAPQRAPFGALVLLDSPNSLDRLYASGAWFVVDGKRVLELCAI